MNAAPKSAASAVSRTTPEATRMKSRVAASCAGKIPPSAAKAVEESMVRTRNPPPRTTMLNATARSVTSASTELGRGSVTLKIRSRARESSAKKPVVVTRMRATPTIDAVTELPVDGAWSSSNVTAASP